MKRKRDYISKKYQNPHLDRDKKKFHLPKVLTFFIVALGLALALYFLLISNSFFSIKDIVIYNDKDLIDESSIKLVIGEYLETDIYAIFPQSNTFFLSASRLQDFLVVSFPDITFDVKKKIFQGKVIVDILGIDAKAMLVSDSKRYFIDENGTATKLIPSEASIAQSTSNSRVIRSTYSSLGLPTIFDESNSDVMVGDLIIDNQLLNFVLDFNTIIMQVSKDIQISHFTIRSLFAEDVTLVSKGGWYAILTTNESASDQATRLLTVIRKKTDSLEYIDLRFGEKVFYK